MSRNQEVIVMHGNDYAHTHKMKLQKKTRTCAIYVCEIKDCKFWMEKCFR